MPQEGRLRFCTELGIIDLAPQEIAIIPRGLVYRVEVLEGPCRGFVCENYGQKFELPGRGPIGANCMANPRDFKAPVAAFEDREVPSTVTVKWCGQFHRTQIGQSPLDVVAWHGNYAPYKYDLRTYCPVGAILFDHPDPSIFTVLTAPSGVPGTANIDFVLFRERWMVVEDTFRPPWYHKNIMSELMGNIYGQYDAKPQGFVPGGMSLHNMMLPHGPDREAFEKASNADLKPEKLENTMSFMFETRFPQHADRICRERSADAGRIHRAAGTASRRSSTARPATSDPRRDRGSAPVPSSIQQRRGDNGFDAVTCGQRQHGGLPLSPEQPALWGVFHRRRAAPLWRGYRRHDR